MKYFTGFFAGIASILLAVIPVTILWTLLTGGTVFGMDIITNFIAMINGFGEAGFTGLLALLLVMHFLLCSGCVDKCTK